MSAWSGVLALSGFRYHGPTAAVTALPRVEANPFRCFWSSGTGWGVFSLDGGEFRMRVIEGRLPCRSCELRAGAGGTAASLNGRAVGHRVARHGDRIVYQFSDAVVIEPAGELRLGARS